MGENFYMHFNMLILILMGKVKILNYILLINLPIKLEVIKYINTLIE